MGMTDLVTGATGLLGSHIAERLTAKGRRVRALVRPLGDTRFLQSLGVELVTGDLTDPDATRRAVRGVENIYHAAAKVGDWGAWPEFRAGCLDATANLGTAAADAGVARFVHISSTSAYGHPAEGGPPVDETAPLGQNLWRPWDYYTISKVEAERILWRLAEDRRLPLSVIRPSWLYGERDRTTTARIVESLRARRARLVGPGDNPLSAVYAGTVADAAILAAGEPGADGEAYNITSHGRITQRDFMNLFAEAGGTPPVSRSIPYRVVFAAATAIEALGRVTRRKRPPLITRYAAWLLGRDLEYSTEKARARLGWSPSPSYRESIRQTVRWYLDQQPSGSTHPAGSV